jgi:hypothetical protein
MAPQVRNTAFQSHLHYGINLQIIFTNSWICRLNFIPWQVLTDTGFNKARNDCCFKNQLTTIQQIENQLTTIQQKYQPQPCIVMAKNKSLFNAALTSVVYPDPHPHQIKIRIRIKIHKLQMSSQNVWIMSLF